MAKNFLFNPSTYTGEGLDAKTVEIMRAPSPVWSITACGR